MHHVVFDFERLNRFLEHRNEKWVEWVNSGFVSKITYEHLAGDAVGGAARWICVKLRDSLDAEEKFLLKNEMGVKEFKGNFH